MGNCYILTIVICFLGKHKIEQIRWTIVFLKKTSCSILPIMGRRIKKAGDHFIHQLLDSFSDIDNALCVNNATEIVPLLKEDTITQDILVSATIFIIGQ